LTDRLNIYMLPTIVCVKDNKVHKQHNGLNEIDGQPPLKRRRSPPSWRS